MDGRSIAKQFRMNQISTKGKTMTTTIAVEPNGSTEEDDQEWRVVRNIFNQDNPEKNMLTVLAVEGDKEIAKLIGRGAALALGCELQVKNSLGQYTTEAASYGNDPLPGPGEEPERH